MLRKRTRACACVCVYVIRTSCIQTLCKIGRYTQKYRLMQAPHRPGKQIIYEKKNHEFSGKT